MTPAQVEAYIAKQQEEIDNGVMFAEMDTSYQTVQDEAEALLDDPNLVEFIRQLRNGDTPEASLAMKLAESGYDIERIENFVTNRGNYV